MKASLKRSIARSRLAFGFILVLGTVAAAVPSAAAPPERGTEILWDHFSKTGPPTGEALLGYGNWSGIGSKHVDDQLALASQKKMRPIMRTRAEIVRADGILHASELRG